MFRAAIGNRYTGTAIGVLSGLTAGSALVFGALYQKVPIYAPEFFGILVPLALFGLIYDLRFRHLSGEPGRWRDTVTYWTLAYPIVRILYDLGLYFSTAARGSAGSLPESFSYYAGPIEMFTWLVFQAMFGTAYGIGFLALHRRLSKRPGG